MTDPLQRIKTPYVRTKVGKSINKLGRSLRSPTAGERLMGTYRTVRRKFAVLAKRLHMLFSYLIFIAYIGTAWWVFWTVYSKVGL